MRILITGGAGFVGATLARSLRAADARHEVVAFDNLHRRGASGLIGSGAAPAVAGA